MAQGVPWLTTKRRVGTMGRIAGGQRLPVHSPGGGSGAPPLLQNAAFVAIFFVLGDAEELGLHGPGGSRNAR